MKFDIKARLRSWPFWVSITALISTILVEVGYVEAPEIIKKYMDLIYPILIGLGILADTSTPGFMDKDGDA